MDKTKKILVEVEVPVGSCCYGRDNWGYKSNCCEYLEDDDWCKLYQVPLKTDPYVSLVEKCKQCLNATECTKIS